jgi:hypothetical protein
MTWRSSWLAGSERKYNSNEAGDIPVLAQTSAMVSPFAWRYRASLRFDPEGPQGSRGSGVLWQIGQILRGSGQLFELGR